MSSDDHYIKLTSISYINMYCEKDEEKELIYFIVDDKIYKFLYNITECYFIDIDKKYYNFVPDAISLNIQFLTVEMFENIKNDSIIKFTGKLREDLYWKLPIKDICKIKMLTTDLK